MKKLMLLSLILTLCTGQSFASYIEIFSDNFNAENSGVGVLNYGGFANWTVSGGTVDLIGNNFYQFGIEGHGLFIDMDGSSGNAGMITTKAGLLDLDPGTYMLSFELAGNQRVSTSEQVVVKILADEGNVFLKENYYNTDLVPPTVSAPFNLFTTYFEILEAGEYYISFEGIGIDNEGMLLDNVKVAFVPLPATILLGFLGLGVGGWKLRRKMV